MAVQWDGGIGGGIGGGCGGGGGGGEDGVRQQDGLRTDRRTTVMYASDDTPAAAMWEGRREGGGRGNRLGMLLGTCFVVDVVCVVVI